MTWRVGLFRLHRDSVVKRPVASSRGIFLPRSFSNLFSSDWTSLALEMRSLRRAILWQLERAKAASACRSPRLLPTPIDSASPLAPPTGVVEGSLLGGLSSNAPGFTGVWTGL